MPVILYPLVRSRLDRWLPHVHFLFGMAACICIYCILFLGWIIVLIPLAIFFNPFAILGLLPYFLLVQIIHHVATTSGSFKPFISGILLCIVFAVGMAIWFNRSYDVVEQALYDSDNASHVPPNYMTELMLGMHIKYHISFCAYDGWRPPLHDPSIVVAVWLNVPFHKDAHRRKYRGDSVCRAPLFFMGDRPAVYKAVFPNNSHWQTCACAVMYSWDYHKDAERMHWPPHEYVRSFPN